MVASWTRVLVSESVSGDNGAAGDGCCRAWMRSLAAMKARSAEDGVGMVTCVGNHASVSEIRSALVALAYTR